jgi:hypothetical protein
MPGDAAEAVLDPLRNELENQKLRAEVRKTDAEARKAQNDLLISHIPTEIPSGRLEAPAQPSPIGVLAAYRALDAVAIASKNRAQHPGAAVVSYALVAPGGTVTTSGVAKAHDCARSDMGSPTIDWSSRRSLDWPPVNARPGGLGR